MIRCYSDLICLETFEDRYAYLDLCGTIGATTFGADRYLNQMLYTSPRWRRVRNEIIIRDNGCDLAHPEYSIQSGLCVHHMNAITIDDILNDNPDIYNPNYLISASSLTHKAIHFGSIDLIPRLPIERCKYDTAPWRK